MLAVALVAVIAAVLVLELGGGGHSGGRRARSAAVPPAKQHSATEAAASYLGLGTSTLRHRLRAGETLAEVADSTPGHSSRGLLHALMAYRAAELSRQHLTPAQVRAKESQLRERLKTQLRHARRIGAALAAASRYLGVSEAALRAQLRSGHTLAEVAAAHGHSRDELIEGILHVRRARLDAAVKAHQITPAEERTALSLLRRRIARAVEAKTG
jgi:hypothetical protein